MKKKYFLILLTVFLSFSGVQSQNDSLRVLTYNIWNGFEWGKDLERKEKTINWIRSRNTDVLALQELNAYTQEKLESDARKWGHNHAILLKTEGYSVGLTSKEPIELIDRVRDGMWHGMLICKTYGIDFYVVHLSPADYKTRKREAGIIQNKIFERKDHPYIVLGDLNAHSPHDSDYMLSNLSLLNKYLKNDHKPSNKYKNTVNDQFDFTVISQLLGTPLIDVSQDKVTANKRFTFPAYGVYKGNMPVRAHLFYERIDYIFASPDLAKNCVTSIIHNGHENDYLSDHYPVEALFYHSKNQ